jgi:hypothetical protein
LALDTRCYGLPMAGGVNMEGRGPLMDWQGDGISPMQQGVRVQGDDGGAREIEMGRVSLVYSILAFIDRVPLFTY